MRNNNGTLTGSRYGAWQMECGVWVIRTKNVCCYLLVGEKQAMLVDTAYGKGNLRQVVEAITDLPLIVVNTHTHYDHSGGNACWPEVWAGQNGEKDAVRGKQLPYPEYTLRTLTDGQIFDLGGRTVQCIAIGAHHPASFAFLDQRGRSLIVGDEIDPSQVLLNLRGDCTSEELISLHRDNMKKLQDLSDQFDRLLPAHNGTPLDNSYLDDFIALSDGILENRLKPCDTVTGYGWSPLLWGGNRKLLRYRYVKASFICKRD